MNKTEIFDFLNQKGISYEATEHKAVLNMEELAEVNLPYPEDNAKNLFVRNDKKRNYYLISVRGEKRVNLKEFRKTHGLKALSFASGEDLLEIMKLETGAVTPFGLLNDDERRVELYFDKSFLEGNAMIGCHPNENTATVRLKSRDLIKLIEEHGNTVHIVEM